MATGASTRARAVTARSCQRTASRQSSLRPTWSRPPRRSPRRPGGHRAPARPRVRAPRPSTGGPGAATAWRSGRRAARRATPVSTMSWSSISTASAHGRRARSGPFGSISQRERRSRPRASGASARELAPGAEAGLGEQVDQLVDVVGDLVVAQRPQAAAPLDQRQQGVERARELRQRGRLLDELQHPLRGAEPGQALRAVGSPVQEDQTGQSTLVGRRQEPEVVRRELLLVVAAVAGSTITESGLGAARSSRQGRSTPSRRRRSPADGPGPGSPSSCRCPTGPRRPARVAVRRRPHRRAG